MIWEISTPDARGFVSLAETKSAIFYLTSKCVNYYTAEASFPFVYLCLPLSLLLLLLFYWMKPRVATKLQVLRHATHTHTNLNEIWNIQICIFFLFLLFPFLFLSSSLSLFSIVCFLKTYWENKDRKKMMSHAPWTTLSQCESDESWRCHLGICFNLLLTSLILSS